MFQVLCDSYKVIIAHFEDMVSPERRPKPTTSVVGRAHQLLKVLKMYRSFMFTFFLCDTLDHLAFVNVIPARLLHSFRSCRKLRINIPSS